MNWTELQFWKHVQVRKRKGSDAHSVLRSACFINQLQAIAHSNINKPYDQIKWAEMDKKEHIQDSPRCSIEEISE